MIPDGWKEETIRELLSHNVLVEVQDGNHGNDHPKSSDYVKDGVPFIMARDLSGGTINFSSCSFISPEQAKSLRIGFSYPNDILLSHKGTIGEVARVPNNYDYIILTPQVTSYRVNSEAKFSSDFLYQYFLSPEFQSVLKAWSFQSTRNYIGITQQKNLIIKYPPLPEQCKIAEILGAWDEAIALLEKLITAKRKLKQGLMQQLLTGKKRFKEFEGSEWETVRLRDITTINYGKSPKTIFSVDGQFPVYGTGGITGYTSTHIYDGESVIIGRKGTIDKVRYVSGKFWAIDTTYYLDCRQMVKAKWIYYFLSFTKLEMLNEASGVPSLNRDTLYSIKINLPSLPEQQKIASVLSAADTEISNLEKQLAAYKQQKRGLMQQLLTGKIRVKIN